MPRGYETVAYPRNAFRADSHPPRRIIGDSPRNVGHVGCSIGAFVRRTRAHTGFTLVELMVTVAIIGIAMAVAIPTIQHAMRDRRLQQEAITFMSAFRDARSRAMMRGRAHLVTINLSGSSAQVDIWEGNVSSCRLSDFSSRTAANHVYQNTMLAASTTFRVTAVSGAPTVGEFCFTPSGRLMYRFDSTSDFVEDNTAGGVATNGGFMYEVSDLAYPDLRVRRVFVPLSGIPRLAP